MKYHIQWVESGNKEADTWTNTWISFSSREEAYKFAQKVCNNQNLKHSRRTYSVIDRRIITDVAFSNAHQSLDKPQPSG